MQTWQDAGVGFISFGNDGINLVWVGLDSDGSLVSYADNRKAYYAQDIRQSSLTDLPENITALLQNFVARILPDFTPAPKSFIPIMECELDGVLYQYVAGLDATGEENGLNFVVSTGETPEIVSFSYIY